MLDDLIMVVMDTNIHLPAMLHRGAVRRRRWTGSTTTSHRAGQAGGNRVSRASRTRPKRPIRRLTNVCSRARLRRLSRASTTTARRRCFSGPTTSRTGCTGASKPARSWTRPTAISSENRQGSRAESGCGIDVDQVPLPAPEQPDRHGISAGAGAAHRLLGVRHEGKAVFQEARFPPTGRADAEVVRRPARISAAAERGGAAQGRARRWAGTSRPRRKSKARPRRRRFSTKAALPRRPARLPNRRLPAPPVCTSSTGTSSTRRMPRTVAQAALNEAASEYLQADAECFGDATVVAGIKVTIKGVGDALGGQVSGDVGHAHVQARRL